MESPEDELVEDLSPFDHAMGGAEKLSPPADFDGPVRDRRVTDPLCLFFLLVMWGVGSWAGASSLVNGDYNTLIHPTDYKGRICGVDNDSSGNLLPTYWHPVDALSNGVCLAECPTESNLEPSGKSDLICKEDADLATMDGCATDGSISDDPNVLITCGGCMYVIGSSKDVSDYCIPDAPDSVIAKVAEIAESTDENWDGFEFSTSIQRILKDLRTAFPIVGGVGFGGAVFFSLLFMLLFLSPPCIAPAVWLSAGLLPAALTGFGVLLFFLAKDYNSDQSLHSKSEVVFIRVLAYIAWTVSALFIAYLVLMAEKIKQAISLSKAVSAAMRKVEMISLFTVFHLLIYSVVFGVFALWLLMMGSAAEYIEVTETVFGAELTSIKPVYSTFAKFKFWFLVFVFWWTTEFLLAIGKLTLSSSFAKWYYTPGKEEGHDISVFSSLCTSLGKHAGTAAFGSLIIKVVQIIRVPFQLLQAGIRLSRVDNGCIDAIICSCQCCLFVSERFLKFPSGEAYIHTSVFGTSFCKSSHESFYLRARNSNISREAGPVGRLSVVFNRSFITIFVSVISFVTTERFYGDGLFSVLTVVVVNTLMAWIFSGIFFDVISVGVSTTLYCFLADEEIMGFGGTTFMTQELDDFLDMVEHGGGNRSRVVPVPYPEGMIKIDSKNTEGEFEAGFEGPMHSGIESR